MSDGAVLKFQRQLLIFADDDDLRSFYRLLLITSSSPSHTPLRQGLRVIYGGHTSTSETKSAARGCCGLVGVPGGEMKLKNNV